MSWSGSTATLMVSTLRDSTQLIFTCEKLHAMGLATI